jgi:hypothetical protein
VQKNDQAMRKSPGHITWVRALGLIMFKEDPPKLYKIKFETILEQLTRENDAFLRNFLRLYIKKEQIPGPNSDY